MVMSSRIIRVERRITCIGSMTDAERALELKSERKKTLGRPWRKWQENIEMGLTENESVL